jgi:hypothetical protein
MTPYEKLIFSRIKVNFFLNFFINIPQFLHSPLNFQKIPYESPTSSYHRYSGMFRIQTKPESLGETSTHLEKAIVYLQYRQFARDLVKAFQ